MSDAPVTDLRGLKGAQGKDGRDRPHATGLAAARPAATLITPDSFYYATDTGVLSYSDGATWADVRVGPGDPVTTLPAAPVDKQQALLTDSLTAPTYAWLLQYESGITDANKWVFVGGSPLAASVDASEATASTSYVDLTTVGPSVTVPRAGVYRIMHGCRIDTANAANSWGRQTIKLGAAAAADAESFIVGSSIAVALAIHGDRLLPTRTLAASDVVKAMFKNEVGALTQTFYYRWLSVQPIRVS